MIDLKQVKLQNKIKKKSPNLEWFKNVGKSLGYTTTDLITDMIPATADLIGNNANTVTEVVRGLRDGKGQMGKVVDSLNQLNQVGIAKDALKNAFEDIKSGKIYNKERQNSVYDDGEFELGDDFDFGGEDDFNFDSTDDVDIEIDGVSGKDSPPIVNKVSVNNIQPPSLNTPVVKAIQQQSQMLVTTTEATNETNIALHANSMVATSRATQILASGITSINDNLSMLVSFNSDNMTKYISASLKYYEDNLSALNSTLEAIAPKDVPTEGSNKKESYDPYDELFLSKGGVNIAGYGKMLKKNFSSAVSSNPFLSPIKAMFEDDDTLKFLAASPLSFISTKIVKSFVPTALQAAMEGMDQTISGFFPALMMKFNRWKDDQNPFKQFFSEVFGYKTKNKSSISLGEYKKDKIDFDGVTKKAIVEVIPTYLRKMLAVLSNKEEKVFDYNEGTFKSVNEISNSIDKRKKDIVTNNFSDVISQILDRSEAIEFKAEKDRDTFKQDVEKFFIGLAKNGKLIKPDVYTKNGIEVDEFDDVYNFSSSGSKNLFRSILDTLSNGEKMRIFGANVIESRRELEKYHNNMEANPELNNAQYIYNKFENDTHLKADKKNGGFKKDDNGNFIVNGPKLGIEVDKFGKTTTDYLREMTKILLGGIEVFQRVTPTQTTGKNRRKGKSSFEENYEKNRILSMETDRNKKLDKLKLEERRYKDKKTEKESNIKTREYTDKQIQSKNDQGITVVDSLSGMSEFSQNQIKDMVNSKKEIDSNTIKINQNDKTIFTFLGKFFSGDSQEKYNLIKDKVNSLLKKPAQLLQGVFSKIDDTLYEIVFGSKGDENKSSFLSKILAGAKERFDGFTTWMKESFFIPMKEAFIGKDGLITKFKESDFFKGMKEKFNKGIDYLFGMKDENGQRANGMLSGVGNSLLDTVDGVKYFFTGKAYTNREGVSFADNTKNSVFGEVKSAFKGFANNAKTYLFGDKNAMDANGKPQKGVLTSAFDSIKDGFTSFGEAIFGPKRVVDGQEVQRVTFKEMTQTIKERAPKSIAYGLMGSIGIPLLGSQLGLMGSLFLPGGPIGGAIVGTTLGFLSQSDKVKDTLFGAKGVDGSRIGGVINKQTQEFFKKNKTVIAGGAALGLTKSLLGGFGIIPSFFMPGGIVGGALMGIGTSLLYRSDKVQDFLFGKMDDTTNERMGGVIQRMFNNDKTNKFGKMAAGAIGGAGIGLVTSKLGILGALMLPGGPIGGAILGAASGIALTSEKWKKYIFGEFDDETGKRDGGLIGKMGNFMKLEVMEPLKIQLSEWGVNMKEWFSKSILNPFEDAIEPMKQQFSFMMEEMKNMFKNGWDSFKVFIGDVFEKHIGKPFGRFMKENVFDPLKKFLNKIIGGISSGIGKLLALPFKGLSMMSEGFTKKQMKRGVDTFVDNEWKDMTDYKGRRERGEKMGLFSTKDNEGNQIGAGIFGRLKNMYFDKDSRFEAAVGKDGAEYFPEEAKRRSERNKKQNEEIAKDREKIAKDKERLNMFRTLGLKNDYDNFISDKYGFKIDISDLYNLGAKTALGKDVPIDNLSRKDKRTLKDFAKNGGMTEVINLEIARREKEKQSKLQEKTEENTKETVTVLNQTRDDLTSATESGNSRLDVLRDTILSTSDKIVNAIRGDKSKDSPDDILTSKIIPFIPRVKETNENPKVSIVDKDKKSNQTDNTETKKPDVTVVNNSNDTEETTNRKTRSKRRKSKDDLIYQMAGDVRVIAEEVKGQLDGVGSNVYKTRKLLQDGFGKSDEDVSGSANRDRIGFWGKVRRSFYKPIDKMKTYIMNKFRTIGEFIGKFVGGVKKVAKTILVDAPKAVWNTVKNVGTQMLDIAGKTIVNISKIPGTILGIVNTALQGGLQVLKAVGPAMAETLMGAASLVSNSFKAVGYAALGFGKGLGEVFKGVGVTLKEVSVGIVKTATTIVNTGLTTVAKTFQMVTQFGLDTVSHVGKMMVDGFGSLTRFTVDTIAGTLNTIKEFGSTLKDFALAPFKFIGEGIGKLLGRKQEVFVVGGTLDRVVEIGADVTRTKKDGPLEVKVINENLGVALNGQEAPIMVTGGGAPIDVNVIGSIDGHIKKAIQDASPIKVKMDDISNTPSVSVKTADTKPKNILEQATNTFSQSMLGALHTFDNHNDKEENKKAKDIEEKAKKEELQQQVSRKSATFVQAEKAAIKEKESEQHFRDSMLQLVGNINKTGEAQRKSWLEVFGLKGLLTVGMLALLPFLKKILNKISNNIKGILDKAWDFFVENPEKRTDADGNIIHNGQGRESIAKAGMKLGRNAAKAIAKKIAQNKDLFGSLAKLGKKGIGKVKGLWDEVLERAGVKVGKGAAEKAAREAAEKAAKKGTMSSADEIVEVFMRNGYKGQQALADNLINYASKNSDNVIKQLSDPKILSQSADDIAAKLKVKPSDIIETTFREVDEVGGAIMKAKPSSLAGKMKGLFSKTTVGVVDDLSDEVVSGVTRQSDSIIKSIMNGVESLFKKGPIQKMLKGGADSVLGAVKKIFSELFTPSIITRYAGKFTAAGAKELLKTAGTVLTAGLSDVGMGIMDAATGAYEAAAIFYVPKDAVCWKMRAAAAVSKALIDWRPTIAICAVIAREVLGLDLKQYVAEAIFAVLASEQEMNDLESAQNGFEADLMAYNEENGTNLSLQAWADKNNTTFWQDAGSAISNGWEAVKQGVKDGGSWVAKLPKALAGMGEKTLNGAAKVVKGASSLASKMKGLFKDGAEETIAAAGKEAAEKTSGAVVEAVTKETDTILKTIKDVITKFTSKLPGKLGKSIGKITSMITGLFDKVLTGSVINKFRDKFVKAVFKETGKRTATAFTLGLSDVLFTGWDIATGSSKGETANIFGVDQNAIDWKMRSAAGVAKGLINFSAIIGLVCEIAHITFGWDIINLVAEGVYSILASDQEVEELKLNQEAFDAEVEEHNAATGQNLSKDEYNNLTNKSFLTRMWDGTKKFFGGKTSEDKLEKQFETVYVDPTSGDKAQKMKDILANDGVAMSDAEIEEMKVQKYNHELQLKKMEKGEALTEEELANIGDMSEMMQHMYGNVMFPYKLPQGKKDIANMSEEELAAYYDEFLKLNEISSDSPLFLNPEQITREIEPEGGMGGPDDQLGITDRVAKSIANGIVGAQDWWEGTKEWASEKWTGVKEGAKWIGDTAKKGFGKAKEWGSDIWQKNKEGWNRFLEDTGEKWEETKTAMSEQWGKLKTKATETWDKFSDKANELWTGAKEFMSEQWTGIKTKATETWDKVSDKANELWTGAKEFMSEQWTGIKTKATETWDKFSDKAGELWTGAKEFMSEQWTGIKTKATETWDKFSDKAEELWGDAKSFMTGQWQRTKDKATEVWDKVSDKAGELWGDAKSSMSKSWESIKTKAGEVWDKLPDETKEKWKEITGKVTEAWNGIKTAIGSVLDVALKPFKKVGELAKKGWSAVKSFFTGSNELEEYYGEGGEGGFGDVKPNGYGKSTKVDQRGGNGRPVQVDQRGGMGVEPDTVNNFSYFAQTDDRWKNYNYDHSPGQGKSANPTIGYRGCGPTSMAMVATQLTGKEYLPTQMADMARNGGYSVSAGTSWSYFDKAAKDFSMDMNKVGTSKSTISQQLEDGRPVILSGKRSKSTAKDKSPFTTGGHFVVAVGKKGDNGLIVNDPRGSAESKVYDFNQVMREAANGWSFKYSGGPTPDSKSGKTYKPGGADYNSDTDGTTEVEEELSILDLFGKMTENFSLYASNIFMDENKQLTFGNTDDVVTDDYGNVVNSNGFTSSLIPKNQREAIEKKTLELTISNESSGNYAAAKNDINGSTRQPISPSIGIMQWRNGQAKQIMQRMYQANPNDKDAKYYAQQVNWDSNAPWSESEQSRLRAYLQRNISITRPIQDEFAMSKVRGNLNHVYKYGVDTGKMKDPKGIVAIGEIGNTGPALIQPFLNAYTSGVNKGAGEFQHFMKEFRSSKSYWGRNQATYKGRMNKTEAALKNWKTGFGGYGECPDDCDDEATFKLAGGYGPDLDKFNSGGYGNIETVNNTHTSKSVVSEKIDQMINKSDELIKATRNDSELEMSKSKAVTDYKYGRSVNNSSDEELMRVAIEYLKEIANNTKQTNSTIEKSIKTTKDVRIVSDNTVSTNIKDYIIEQEGQPNVIISQNGGGSTNNLFQQKQNGRIDRNYNAAKAISRGR